MGGYLFLVSQDVWENNERILGQGAFLPHVYFLEWHLLYDAYFGGSWFSPKACGRVPLRNVPSPAATERFHDVLCYRHGSEPDYLCSQFLLEHVLWASSWPESLEFKYS